MRRVWPLHWPRFFVCTSRNVLVTQPSPKVEGSCSQIKVTLPQLSTLIRPVRHAGWKATGAPGAFETNRQQDAGAPEEKGWRLLHTEVGGPAQAPGAQFPGVASASPKPGARPTARAGSHSEPESGARDGRGARTQASLPPGLAVGDGPVAALTAQARRSGRRPLHTAAPWLGDGHTPPSANGHTAGCVSRLNVG